LVKKIFTGTQLETKGDKKMATFDKNKLAFIYANALQDFKDAKVKEKLEGYDIELTLERVEYAGWLDGFELGALAGFRHAIALLQSEQFTEHARILEDQLKNLDAIFELGE
jgi:hypothetical protein